jgi:hypothetical protein
MNLNHIFKIHFCRFVPALMTSTLKKRKLEISEPWCALPSYGLTDKHPNIFTKSLSKPTLSKPSSSPHGSSDGSNKSQKTSVLTRPAVKSGVRKPLPTSLSSLTPKVPKVQKLDPKEEEKHFECTFLLSP